VTLKCRLKPPFGCEHLSVDCRIVAPIAIIGAVTYHPEGRAIALFLDKKLNTPEIQGTGLHPTAEALV
jgi:hypothetical protein